MQHSTDVDQTLMGADPFKLVGTTLAGKYRIDEILGEGGFGVVYLGRHLVIGAPIAIKRMKPFGDSLKDQAAAAERFLREAKLLFSLTHPSIVRMYDVGTITSDLGTVPYVVLEYLDGGSLEHEIAARAARRDAARHFSAAELLRLFQPILEGVQYLHANGVAHRDLKPSNIMLMQSSTRGVQARIVDFGIARWIGDEGRTHGARGTAFTPRYAAPEQWDPKLGTTGPATDVFALGLILAEALTLKPVFGPGAPAELFVEVMRRQEVDVESVRPDLPKQVKDVLACAMNVDPRRRFETAGELLAALEAVISPEDGEARSSRMSPSVRSLPRTAPVRSDATHLPTIAAPATEQREIIRRTDTAPVVRPPPSVGRIVPCERTAPSAQGVVRAVPSGQSRFEPSALPRVLTSDDDHMTAIWGPVFFTVWKKVSRVEAARAIQYALRDLAASVPGRRVACLTVIEPRADLPDADTRTAVANIFRFNAESIVCSANVMEGEGFRAAAVRGVVTGIALVARQPFPNHVFPSVSLSAAWICRALVNAGAASVAPGDLIAAVDEVRASAARPVTRPSPSVLRAR